VDNYRENSTNQAFPPLNFYYICNRSSTLRKNSLFFKKPTQPLPICSTSIDNHYIKGSLMQIQFIRNIQFTKLVKADGRLREFNFRKSNGLQEGLFTVDVSDDRGNRIVLRMQREDGVWKIIKQQLPAWIWENEANFHTLIEDELGGSGMVK
jgi:hypothetical protein